MLQPETPNTYPGLLEACRAHIAKIQPWHPGNAVYTFFGIDGSNSFDWTLQLISTNDNRLMLDIALSLPNHIEAFRNMKTFARWRVSKDEPADLQATLNMPTEAERCEKYIAVLLHKVLGVGYGTALLTELSETASASSLPAAERAEEAAPHTDTSPLIAMGSEPVIPSTSAGTSLVTETPQIPTPEPPKPASTTEPKDNATQPIPQGPVKKVQPESKAHTLVYIAVGLILVLLLGIGFVIYLLNRSSDNAGRADSHVAIGAETGPTDYQGYMDWEYGITLRLTERDDHVEGQYNNNAYPNTFLEVEGSRSGTRYRLTLHRQNGDEMGSFTLTRTGRVLLGSYYDTRSGTDHRVEISDDLDNPVRYQTDPAKEYVEESPSSDEEPAVNDVRPTRVTNDHAYVDLGLPSGICWATCNLGAYSPEDFGDSFAWGETSRKYEYSQSSYSCRLGTSALSAHNDAAAQTWGGTWRTPTKTEWQELVNYCSWHWTGAGYRVTGRNGNTIYLPAAGYCKGSSRFKEGERGDYWSATPNGAEKSYEFVIKSDLHNIDSDSRYYGASIRAVTN